MIHKICYYFRFNHEIDNKKSSIITFLICTFFTFKIVLRIYFQNHVIKSKLKMSHLIQNKEKKRTCKSSLESEWVYNKRNKSNVDKKNYFYEISTSQIETINGDTSDKEWVKVHKQLISVKTCLKANTVV